MMIEPKELETAYQNVCKDATQAIRRLFVERGGLYTQCMQGYIILA